MQAKQLLIFIDVLSCCN